MPDLTDDRRAALWLAVELHRDSFMGGAATEIVATADAFWEFLTAPVSLLIIAGPVVDQTTGRPTGNPGGTDMAPVKDSDKFPLLVTALDSKQNPTTAPTDVTFSSSDTTVVTISDPDANGVKWAIAGQPGSAVITGDWPDSPHGDLQGTLAVDVTAGDAATLVITAGDPVPQ